MARRRIQERSGIRRSGRRHDPVRSPPGSGGPTHGTRLRFKRETPRPRQVVRAREIAGTAASGRRSHHPWAAGVPAVSPEARCGSGSHRSTGFRRRPAAERRPHCRSDRGSSPSPWCSPSGCNSAQAAHSHILRAAHSHILDEAEEERNRCCSTGCCSRVPADCSRPVRPARRCRDADANNEHQSLNDFRHLCSSQTFPLLGQSTLLRQRSGIDRFLFTALANRGVPGHIVVARDNALVDHGFAVRPTSRQNRRVGNAHRPLRPRDRCRTTISMDARGDQLARDRVVRYHPA